MSRALALAYVAGLFVLGVLVGALAMQLWHTSHPAPVAGPALHRQPFGGFGAGLPQRHERMLRQLGATPEQRARIEEILARSHAHSLALRAEILPRMREQMERTRAEIAEVLTPEQRERFERWHREHRPNVERLLLGR